MQLLLLFDKGELIVNRCTRSRDPIAASNLREFWSQKTLSAANKIKKLRNETGLYAVSQFGFACS